MNDQVNKAPETQIQGGQPAVTAVPGNPWAKVSEIAAKVGVKPYESTGQATIVAYGADGRQYDVWEIVSAVLDKLDKRGS